VIFLLGSKILFSKGERKTSNPFTWPYTFCFYY